MFWKRNTDPRWRVISASVRGASHVRANKPNQDAYFADPERGEAETIRAFVADGHGGTTYTRSEKGSRLAVETAARILGDDFGPESFRGDGFGKRMVEAWLEAVDADIREGEEPAERITYGTTLLGCIGSGLGLAFFQLGDGDILAVDSSGIRPVFAPDPRFLGGETLSMCSPNAVENLRWLDWNEPLPDMIMLSTDGYANSFPSADGFYEAAGEIAQHAREQRWHDLETSLPRWLADTTQRGSGDDITVVILARA